MKGLTSILFIVCILGVSSCDDFLSKAPLDTPSEETFWKTPEQAEMWVNDLYRVGEPYSSVGRSLQGVAITTEEAYSDNAYGRATIAANNIANGTFDETDSHVASLWDKCYRNIRLSLEFFENVERVPEISQSKMDKLSGQVRFFLAYEYFKLITKFRDVPLVTKPLSIEESDIKKSSKDEVLSYILEQLDTAIERLPDTWPTSETGRITKGAALFLKTRVLLYNKRWDKAAETAKEVIDSNMYELHPTFGELFRTAFDNNKKGIILEIQYTPNTYYHNLSLRFSPVMFNAHALIQPTPQLVNSFRMKDGLPINESLLYDPEHPFQNRDSRFYDTFLWHGQILNDTQPPLDLTGSESNYSATYIYFKKGIVDFRDGIREMGLNWNLFRYADLLLMYAEAKNEASGPEASIYDVLDLIRERAGMPDIDRNRYNKQTSLRSLIRNERRVELAGEGLRYNDIIRWRIADSVLNHNITSMDLTKWADGPVDSKGNPILVPKQVEARTFDPNKDYVWPIPQHAIDRSDHLTQNSEWQ